MYAVPPESASHFGSVKADIAAATMRFEDKMFVLGVGAPKAGTTWLHEYLSQRGDIFLPRSKEMHYFSRRYRPDLYGGGRKPARIPGYDGTGSAADDWGPHNPYKVFFRKRVPADVNFYGEITPTYAAIGVPGYREIRALFPRIKIIFILRDPVQRFYSQIRMFQNKRVAVSKSKMPLPELVNSSRFTEMSSYDKTISDLESVFSKEEVIYLFYETLFSSDSIAKLCSALEMPYMPAEFDRKVNSGGDHDPVPSEVHKNLEARFAGTYDFCRKKFGSALPWEPPASNEPVPDPLVQSQSKMEESAAELSRSFATVGGPVPEKKPSLPRVFVIGFNKCGTRTIHGYFKTNGYNSVHWDKGELAATIFRNLVESEPLLTGYEQFSVFSDMENIRGKFVLEAYKLYPYFFAQYPDSLFILNTRNLESWIKSRLEHGGGGYAKKWRRCFGVASDKELVSRWREEWNRHHKKAEAFLVGHGARFLKFDIENDSPEKLNLALPEYRLDSSAYKHRGRTTDSEESTDGNESSGAEIVSRAAQIVGEVVRGGGTVAASVDRHQRNGGAD